MKGAHSISTRRAYGVQRVCRVWHRARSSVYAQPQATTSPGRRGPVGAAPDDVLVGHIGRMLEASPFHGEGVPESLGEASGRGNPHVPGAGAPVDAGARPPGCRCFNCRPECPLASAVQQIIARSPGEHIGTLAALQAVVPGAAGEVVRSVAALEQIVARSTDHQVAEAGIMITVAWSLNRRGSRSRGPGGCPPSVDRGSSRSDATEPIPPV